jgi:hypothetical protein
MVITISPSCFEHVFVSREDILADTATANIIPDYCARYLAVLEEGEAHSGM